MTNRDYAWGLVIHVLAFVLLAWLALCFSFSGPWPLALVCAIGAAASVFSLGRLELEYRRSRWSCRSCGAWFTSKGGRITGGVCPNGRPTCPLEPPR